MFVLGIRGDEDWKTGKRFQNPRVFPLFDTGFDPVFIRGATFRTGFCGCGILGNPLKEGKKLKTLRFK